MLLRYTDKVETCEWASLFHTLFRPLWYNSNEVFAKTEESYAYYTIINVIEIQLQLEFELLLPADSIYLNLPSSKHTRLSYIYVSIANKSHARVYDIEYFTYLDTRAKVLFNAHCLGKVRNPRFPIGQSREKFNSRAVKYIEIFQRMLNTLSVR